MKLTLSIFVALFGAINPAAAELAIYRGSFESRNTGSYFDMRAGAGMWLSVPANCGSLQGKVERGFALFSNDVNHNRNYRCSDAKIYLDLSESSYCRDLTGPDIYSPPVVVSVQCID